MKTGAALWGALAGLALPFAAAAQDLAPLSTFNNPWRPDELNRCH